MVLNIYTIMSKLLFHIFISLIELFFIQNAHPKT